MNSELTFHLCRSFSLWYDFFCFISLTPWSWFASKFEATVSNLLEWDRSRPPLTYVNTLYTKTWYISNHNYILVIIQRPAGNRRSYCYARVHNWCYHNWVFSLHWGPEYSLDRSIVFNGAVKFIQRMYKLATGKTKLWHIVWWKNINSMKSRHILLMFANHCKGKNCEMERHIVINRPSRCMWFNLIY